MISIKIQTNINNQPGLRRKLKNISKGYGLFRTGNSEEQLKREELIRSEARRQYENIRKNRLELDKISTGQESTIEEIKDDPILAKMIPTLNQEHLDVYRETIKNTDFPESGNEDQLKEWSKNFIDTRNKFRNEFDKKFEMTLGGTTIGESDKGSRKNGNWLRSSTHGSKKAEDEPTKILRSDSDKDKKAQTPVSMIRTESTSKPAESKTTEILSSDSPQVEKPSNLSLIDEQQSTSKPADDRSTIIPASDSHQVKKPESTVSDLKDQQSITKPADEQVTKIESSDSQIVKKPSNLNLIDDQQSITKPADDQVTKILSSDSHQVKKPDSTVNVVNESTPKPPSTTVSDVNAQQSPLKSAHDRSTIITASDSHQDKKSPSIVSVLNEQESTSKPAYNQGTIIPSK
ncbi:uncharacterized protein LOC142645589 isoform X1 [Dermatophagoides pteronyssinus]|uniref:uncharacterized protein LOC142645589 isoform X1 n=1 Tax=Dermatophagoides pteronyssinus TaxID=6956 RepID=UPI003F672FCE